MSTKRDNHESMAQKVEKRLVDAHLREGETGCMANINPFTLLFAPDLHPELRAKFHHKIQKLYDPDDCDGLRPLPCGVVDCIDDTIIADPKAPKVFVSFQFLHATSRGVTASLLYQKSFY
jgi:hypothetical protein